MFSITSVTGNSLHSIYMISYTMLFAMFVVNMFTSVISEIREELIKIREEEKFKLKLD